MYLILGTYILHIIMFTQRCNNRYTMELIVNINVIFILIFS